MPRRISVNGTSGAGKTTFATELARRLDLPFIELDALHHGPNWSEPTAEEFQVQVRTALADATEGWVVDGNYHGKLGATVLAAADTIVWLDLPLGMKLSRIWRRTRQRIRDDVELWNGNRESWRGVLLGSKALLPWTVRAHRRHRREWPARFAGDPRLVRLRSVAEVERWLEGQTRAGSVADKGGDNSRRIVVDNAGLKPGAEPTKSVRD